MLKILISVVIICSIFISCTFGNHSNKKLKEEITIQTHKNIYTIEFMKEVNIRDSVRNKKIIGKWFKKYIIRLNEKHALLKKFKNKKIIYGEYNPTNYKNILQGKYELNRKKYNTIKYYVDSIPQ